MKGIILPKRIFIIAALLGWSFDLFFYGKALGISLPLFVLLESLLPSRRGTVWIT